MTYFYIVLIILHFVSSSNAKSYSIDTHKRLK